MPFGRRRKRSRQASPPSAATSSRASGRRHDHVRPSSSEEVMVKRDLLVTCVTCLLCRGLLRDATTIPECLHTFCRKCIMKKLVDEEEECCPTCKTDLGVAPADKLRTDHHLQSIRETVFPLKRKRIISEDPPPNPIPNPNPNSNPNQYSNSNSSLYLSPQIQTQSQKVKKERSLSSLVEQNGMMNQPKASKRMVSLSEEKVSHSTKGNVRKKAKVEPKQEEKGTLPPVMMTYTRRQNNSDREGSNGHTPTKDSEKKTGPFCEIPEIEGPNGQIETETCANENKEECEKKNGENSVKTKRNYRKRNKISAQTLVSTRPVWFSLIASPHMEEEAVLPQLTANYLRIRDGNIPVSSIQKYIKSKLGLNSETEVEIICRGLPIDPSNKLHSLINIWIRNESSHKIKTLVGSSAKDFVMVLMYHLKSDLHN